MSKLRGPFLLGLAALVAFSMTGFANEDGTSETAKLSYKTYPKWTIILPKEEFTSVAGKIAIPHAGGNGFVAVLDGTALAVDSNGDGKPDVKAKGTAGMVTLKARNAEGRKFRYAVRLKNEGGWKYAAAGAMVGKVKGTKVTLIDQNNNGSYADVGVDAMIVGKGHAASFLSKIIVLGKDLYEIEVSEDGSTISFSPFTGETGILNIRKKFNSRGKLVAGIVRSSDGDTSFNLASMKKGLAVPVGTYEIVSGLVSKGKETVKIRGGKSKPITVAAGQESLFEWGGPLRAEFDYTREGDSVTFAPQNLWFYGKSGEEYYDWFPEGQPPKFVIANAKNGREEAQAKFGGC